MFTLGFNFIKIIESPCLSGYIRVSKWVRKTLYLCTDYNTNIVNTMKSMHMPF